MVSMEVRVPKHSLGPLCLNWNEGTLSCIPGAHWNCVAMLN